MMPLRWRGVRRRSRAIGRGLLLALGLVNQMRAGHASTERFSIPQPARGQGPGASSKDGISGKLHRSRRRPARGSTNALNSKALPIGWVRRPADGVHRSGHGTKDFLKVLRARLARSGVGAEPAPTGAGKKAPAGPSTVGGRGLSLQISGDAISITLGLHANSDEDHVRAREQGFCINSKKWAARHRYADLDFFARPGAAT